LVGNNGQIWQPYVRTNYWNQWGGDAATTYAGLGATDSIPVASRARYMDADIGVSTWFNERLSGFVDFGYQFAVGNSAGQLNGLKGSIGLRYQFK
jgi:outer membrane autotransporter protein